MDLDAVARQCAMEDIKRALRTPDDLEKLAQLRAEFEQKRISSESQLSAAVQTQLSDMQGISERMEETKHEVDVILNEFKTLNELCDASKNSTEQYPKIKAVHVARRNLRSLLVELDFYDLIPTMVPFFLD